ncbi:MAG TPA: hypothetical protein VFJ58_28165 [Armatimonadota bacterium]|nr:hypothetical protein [Armatimonadota bacterium]
MKVKFASALMAITMAAYIAGFALPVSSASLPKPVILRGTRAGMTGPNLMADWSFESMRPGAFTLNAPFQIVLDPHAHSGKADVQAVLTNSGKSIYSHVGVWKNTDYVSRAWIKGSGSVTFFAAARDLSQRLATTTVTAAPEWREVSLPWSSGGQTRVAVGFQDDVSAKGTFSIDDFYTGLKDGRTIKFVAPPTYDARPHAPPEFRLIFDDEFKNGSTIDANNTQNDGYKWYVKGMWFPTTTPSMWAILPTYEGASGVLEIKDAPVSMSWDFSTTLFDNAAPEGYRGTVFLPGKGIYYEARVACADLAHISKNGWAGFWSGTMPVSSRPRNMNPPPWGFTPANNPMPGWPGKWEAIENDILEYNPSWGHPEAWDSTIHDWSSAPAGNIGNWNSVVYAPARTDYTQWHTYGQLWVPASAENGWHGYRQVYFDGVPQQAICWIGNQISKASQPAGSYLFSMCDGTPDSPPL